jgi:TRAP-type C4-dicarboxylate transport system permease small subunit
MLHVDMFVSKAGPRGQSVMSAIAALAGLAFFSFVCFGSFEGATTRMGDLTNSKERGRFAFQCGLLDLFSFWALMLASFSYALTVCH